ncbi:RNA polymerase sigma factor [Acidicapsa ligni]|uniref:RNA polymerase sigma factor n=1 Tax=Acidicapsa ligni TaxID=542300 RepID=UPI0021E018E3|nr:RNA polymerase sigma factor [Acidicapsa ligni]
MQNAITIAGLGEPLTRVVELAEEKSAAFASLVERHSRLIFRIALAVTRDSQDAEDVVQETFLQIYKGDRWQQLDDEQAYLARTAWRLAVRKRRSPAQTHQEELSPSLQAPGTSPENLVMDQQMERKLHALIDQLPEKLRQPLALSALGELKLVEIAVILNIPEGTVRRRIHSARQLLRNHWENLRFQNRKGGTE